MEVREFLFYPIKENSYSFSIRAKESGVFSGAESLETMVAELDLRNVMMVPEGEVLSSGSMVFSATSDAETVAKAEEILLGVIGKSSGVATAAAAFAHQVEKVKVVCGAWKKLNSALRKELRRAVMTGGVGLRMTEEPFIYLDKNYIRMFRGIAAAVARAKQFDPARLVVAQLRGESIAIAAEANLAVEAGADILMIDTGQIGDFKMVANAAEEGGWRTRVQLAFAGGVNVKQLAQLSDLGADIVDVGRAILDAPLLDFSLDVEGEA